MCVGRYRTGSESVQETLLDAIDTLKLCAKCAVISSALEVHGARLLLRRFISSSAAVLQDLQLYP